MHFFADAVIDAMRDSRAPDQKSDLYDSFTFARLTSDIELAAAALSLLGAIILLYYYARANRRDQLKWTVDQVNTSLIPLAVAVTFIVIYYVTR